MGSIIGNFPEEFESFGPSLITERAMGDPTTVDLPAVAAEFRPTLRRDCPSTPGIFNSRLMLFRAVLCIDIHHSRRASPRPLRK